MGFSLPMFFETLDEVFSELKRRKASRDSVSEDEMITVYEESPYGGYRIRSVPAEIYIEDLQSRVESKSKRVPSRDMREAPPVYR